MSGILVLIAMPLQAMRDLRNRERRANKPERQMFLAEPGLSGHDRGNSVGPCNQPAR
jgi:methylmalonyl-CoA mutase cobalamin-binding subunit